MNERSFSLGSTAFRTQQEMEFCTQLQRCYSYRRSKTVKLTSKGQVTIPQEIRDRLGLHPGTEVEFDIVDETVRIRRAATQEERRRRVRAWIERARGSAKHTKVRLTTDQIMALTRGED